MSRFSVGIVGRGQNVHASCFEDVAEALSWSLRELGHEVVGFENPGRIIAFGSNNVTDPDNKIPADMIVYNSEQLPAVHEASTLIQNFPQYKSHVVWDYAKVNIERLQGLGISRAIHCPIGYAPTMEKSLKADAEDIDILYYGSVNARRREVLDELGRTGLRVVTLFGVYGKERDDYIARAKVVLNLHFYERAVFEIFRVSHLLANRKCVVSESGSLDVELEAFADRVTFLASRERIVDACKEMVADATLRRAVAERGYEEFRKTSFVENVGRALEKSA